MKLSAALLLGMTAMAHADDAHRPLVGRSLVTTRYGIVASSQPLAARAGTLILERGGNAVDAAIATNAAVGVMEPAMNGVGGDLFVLYWDAKAAKLYGLNASGWAPTGLTPALVASKGVSSMPRDGAFSVTVPGAVAGWQALRDKFGTKPLSELLAPAIHYANEGFPVGEITAQEWAAASGRVSSKAAARTYLPEGRPPVAGQVFKNPDLARTLSRVAEQGRGVGATGVGVDHDAVAGRPAEKLVHRQSGNLALDVPERGIHRGDRRHGDRPAAPVRPAVEVLPHVLDAGGILADQQRHDVVPQVARHAQLAAVQGGVAEAGDAVGCGDSQGHEVPARRGHQHLGAFNLAHRSHSLGRSGHPAQTRA